MRAVAALLALTALGCGRLGFEDVDRDAPGDGMRDGAPDDLGSDASGGLATRYVKPATTGIGDRFGAKIALSADGTTLAIGAYSEASDAVGINGDPSNDAAPLSGAVYLFVRTPGAWMQQAFVKASNTDAGDVFGWSVALSADGNVLAVGAPDEASGSQVIDGNQADNTAASAGAVYVFTRAGTTWSQQAYLKATNAEAGDGFGETIALSEDGRLLAVGAIREDGASTGTVGNPASNDAADAGAVYVFRRPAATWIQEAYLKASNTDPGDAFGAALALSGGGTRLAVSATSEASGSPGIDGAQLDNGQPQAGAVYVFNRNTTFTWTQDAYVKPSNPDGGDFFGVSLGLSRDGTTLAVTAEGEDGVGRGVDPAQTEGAGQAGAAYVFTRGSTWSQQVYLKAFNTTADDRFGRCVGLAADGNTLVVGARFEDSAATGIGGAQDSESATNSGAIYVYRRSGSLWMPGEYAKATNTEANDGFGSSVAISGSGTTFAIGADAEDSIDTNPANNDAADSGAVYVIE